MLTILNNQKWFSRLIIRSDLKNFYKKLNIQNRIFKSKEIKRRKLVTGFKDKEFKEKIQLPVKLFKKIITLSS
ncbi:MAG: hypothetical protein EHM20_04795 [Alphaproteobacteria bacterium]|nr:MAG: hypothetical protein EHM20_04795 [Alphaproteobacteria bacterium]